MTGQCKNKIPGWDATISHEREIALFWRSIWINLNSPRDGIVAGIMRRTRAKYHYSVRKLKRENNLLKRKAMANAIIENNSRQLWTEVRKIRHTNSSCSNCIDGVIGDIKITELFANKYDKLYNSVSFEQQKMSGLMDLNYCDIQEHCVSMNDNDTPIVHTHCISVQQVTAAIHKLKPSKSDCIDGIYSDNFKHGTRKFCTIISMLFTAMLTHGVVPVVLLLSTLVPIPRIRGVTNVIQITTDKLSLVAY